MKLEDVKSNAATFASIYPHFAEYHKAVLDICVELEEARERIAELETVCDELNDEIEERG